jgi:hypothetical protein
MLRDQTPAVIGELLRKSNTSFQNEIEQETQPFLTVSPTRSVDPNVLAGAEHVLDDKRVIRHRKRR